MKMLFLIALKKLEDLLLLMKRHQDVLLLLILQLWQQVKYFLLLKRQLNK